MNPPSTNRYKHHRCPAEIISHAVWLYFRFCLSYRDMEEFLFARGIVMTYEAIRQWCRKFGQHYAHRLRRRRPQPGDNWHLDEVFLTIMANGTTCGGLSIRTVRYWMFLCRAVGTSKPRGSSSARWSKD